MKKLILTVVFAIGTLIGFSQTDPLEDYIGEGLVYFASDTLFGLDYNLNEDTIVFHGYYVGYHPVFNAVGFDMRFYMIMRNIDGVMDTLSASDSPRLSATTNPTLHAEYWNSVVADTADANLGKYYKRSKRHYTLNYR